MFSIKINNEFLNLSDGATISFDLNSPVYLGDDTDIIPGSYSFPFSIPLDHHNRQVLGFPDRLDVDTPLIKDEPSELWNNGRLLFSGLATIKSANTKTAKIFLIVNPLAALKDKKLNEFELETVTAGTNNVEVLEHMKDTAEFPEYHNYIFFPVWNPLFHSEDPGYDHSREEYMNYYDQSGESFQYSFANLAWVPFIKLNYLFEKAIESINYVFDNQFQNTTELSRLLLYNNYSIIDGINIGTQINLNNHVNPDTEFTELFKNVCRLFCLAPFSNIFNKTVKLIPLRDVLTTTPLHNWTSKAAANYEKSEDTNYPVKFMYGDMLATAPSDFYQGEKTEYDYRVQDITGWTPPSPVVRATVYHFADDALWRYDDDMTPEFEFMQSFIPEYDTGDDGDEYESSLETLIISTTPPAHDNTASWLVPQLGEAGSYQQTINPYNDRLIFYRGMQDFRGGAAQYPMASNNIYDASFTHEAIPGLNYSLLWDGDQGLYNQWWKNWLEMLQNKQDVTIKLNLNEDDIINFNFDEKVRIGNQNYFVKNLSITLTQNGFKPTTAELVSTL